MHSPRLLKRVGRIFKPETASPAQITLAICPSLYYLQFIIPLGPEDTAREQIDRKLEQAGLTENI
jgi:hypothetical protein